MAVQHEVLDSEIQLKKLAVLVAVLVVVVGTHHDSHGRNLVAVLRNYHFGSGTTAAAEHKQISSCR